MSQAAAVQAVAGEMAGVVRRSDQSDGVLHDISHRQSRQTRADLIDKKKRR